MTVMTNALIPALEDVREAHAAVVDYEQYLRQRDQVITAARQHTGATP